MGSVLILTAGLFVGQVQEVQAIGPVQQQQQAPGGLFGRWRSAWQDHPVWSKIHDRIGNMFGRGHNQQMKEGTPGAVIGSQGVVTASQPRVITTRVTTDEPPLLEIPTAQPQTGSPRR